ncbi:MAG: NAD(P)-binding domain-containing protein [Myxococcales bacterium]|nr:NAD(P)-binding domain-containing protein [Myxococcales bacterium]
MTWVVPLGLGGLAIAVMALFTMLGARKARLAQAVPNAAAPRILIHDINDDRCTGCDACVAVCPTNVLDLVANKSRVLRFHDCIQCEACMWACPTEALVMFPEGSEPQALKVPELDDSYQTGVPGQYLIGEVAGKPLVKNAANLGRGVIEHMLRTGLRGGALGTIGVDVVIVGSGPGGLSAALTCLQRGLSYVLLEKEQEIASTITRYPKGKLVMAEPYDTRNLSLLPVFDSSKEQLVAIWRELIERTGVRINQGEAVEAVQRLGDGTFDVRTTVAGYRAQRVILATGTRGKPRTLQVPGENLPKVANLLEDPDDWRGKDVLVVGGGDSAVEAAVALADAGARVIISYRGKSFNRAAPKNKQTIEGYAGQQRLKTKYGSQVVAFEPDAVILQLDDGSQKRYPNHGAFVLIGADPPVTWLEKLGVRFVLRPHQYSLGKTDDFLRRLAGDLQDCPEDAARAAEVITGRPQAPSTHGGDRLPSEVERALAAVSLPDAASGPKKWLRAATGLFGTSPGKKVEQPIPLSEFAKRQRTGASGRRDALSAGERTRVLRMLRDEGGRLADEESRVSFVDLAALRSAPPAREPTPIPRPARATGRPAPGSVPPPNGDIVAKPAVIVGLAKATAAGPRTRSGRADEIELGPGVRMKPGKAQRAAAALPAEPPPRRGPVTRAPPVAQFTEEPTRQVDAPGRALRRAADRRAEFDREDPTRAASVDPRLLAQASEDATRMSHIDPRALMQQEDATRLSQLDPRALMASGDATRMSRLDPLALFEEESTRHDGDGTYSGDSATGSIDLGPRDQSRRFPRLPEEDATRMSDLDALVATERERARGARPAPPSRASVHDEATRAIDIGRPTSMSDVDWDLD